MRLSGKILVLVLAAVVWSCGAGGDTIVLPDVGIDTALDDGYLPDTAKPDQAEPDLRTEDSEDALDGDAEGDGKIEPTCAPGEGCFLDPCTANEQCVSGFCVEHMGDSVCTIGCLDECPAGWTCKQVSGVGPDVQFLCVSNYTTLCKPCGANSDCQGLGSEDVCVVYGGAGNFCGGACKKDSDCPWGFWCADSKTVAGTATKQCVAETGLCPCTKTSISQGLSTPCSVKNEFGTCHGKRVCVEGGLSECDANVAAAESCNGLDDDCDGDIDEPNYVQGKALALCDDGNDCTEDACMGADGCQHTALNQTECKDGDPCTVADICKSGICVGTSVVCDDYNPCTDDTCNETGGCVFTNNTQDCDDSNPCTVADQCKQGVCVGVPVSCDCKADADCAPLEDGNKCNGTLFCDKSGLPFQCKVSEETVVVCPEPQGPNAPCLQPSCNPETGACSFTPAKNGLACEDGNECTVKDSCLDGVCVAGVAANCNDGNVCTEDSCDPQGGCKNFPNNLPCNDGNACTSGDTCVLGDCVGGPSLPCDDGNPCTDDSCDSVKGCVFTPNSAACDDGNPCTAGDKCAAGSCLPTGATICNDDNPCTDDSCNPAAGGCVHTHNSAPCSDGNPCTLNDTCKQGVCAPGPLVSCDDGNPCTTDSCGQNGICVHVNNTAECSDQNACTTGDVCQGGKCTFKAIVDCNDDNVCTTDTCDPEKGCLYKNNTMPCTDNDVCTLGDHCELGVCVSTGNLVCDDNNSCTDDSCNPVSGCSFTPNAAQCDDGNACTGGDQCSQGVCKGGFTVSCDDGNPCTTDVCDIANGCANILNNSPCDDGDACTIGDSCSLGICKGLLPLNCFDNDVCTDEYCDPVLGCVYSFNTKPCDDGNACTTGEACNQGVCENGQPVSCNDGNVCTDDSCDSATGCIHVANTADCEDGDKCTLADKCQNGTCQPGTPLVCDDNNICTTDSCDPKIGCVIAPAQDYTPCGPDKVCLNGECVCSVVHGSQTLTLTNSIQNFTVPACVTSLTIEAFGAQGGKNVPCTQQGGKGARMKGTFTVTPGEMLKVVVAGRGKDRGSDTSNQSGTGGGGSFVWRNSNAELLIAAGGGGGGAICTSGGGASYATGKNGVTDNSGTTETTNTYAGGSNGADGGGQCPGKGWNSVKNNPAGYGSGGEQGGYGGGGTVGASHGGGGGGGYSGGAGKAYTGYPAAAGGGGGSYNIGSNPSGDSGVQTNDGKVVLTW